PQQSRKGATWVCASVAWAEAVSAPCHWTGGWLKCEIFAISTSTGATVPPDSTLSLPSPLGTILPSSRSPVTSFTFTGLSVFTETTWDQSTLTGPVSGVS